MKLDRTGVDSKYVIFALIFMISNKLQTIGDNFFEEVSTKQWLVLLVLSIMGDYSPTLNELSEAVGSSHQNVKQLVMKLEQKGYLEVTKDTVDARRLRIKATEKCKAFHDAYAEKSAIFLNRLFQGMAEEELKVTENIMIKLKEVLEGMAMEYVRE